MQILLAPWSMVQSPRMSLPANRYTILHHSRALKVTLNLLFCLRNSCSTEAHTKTRTTTGKERLASKNDDALSCSALTK